MLFIGGVYPPCCSFTLSAGGRIECVPSGADQWQVSRAKDLFSWETTWLTGSASGADLNAKELASLIYEDYYKVS